MTNMKIVRYVTSAVFLLSVLNLVRSADSNSLSTCENLPVINNGELLLGDREPPFAVNEFIAFRCDEDFKSDLSNPRVTCILQDNVANWTDTEDACKPIIKSCHDPGDIEDADRIGNLFFFPHNITYVCRQGFRIKGTATRYCSKTGHWQPPNMPYCEAIYCPPLLHPQNGEVLANNRRLNSLATYKCNRKYNLSGSAVRICQEDGTWNGTNPICKEITCMDPGPLKYGRIIGLKKVYLAFDIIIFRCDDGVIHTTSKCTEAGEWSARPPVCTKVEDDLNPVKSTTLSPSEINTSEGVTICEDPGQIKNGYRSIVGYDINSTVTYTCHEGYELRGKSTLFCLQNGKWDLEKLPICVKLLSVPAIIGIVFGVVIFICLIAGIYLWYRYRIKGVRGYGKKSKALTADATDIEEVTGLERERKYIPVTVL